ncbi:hypothetical protein [Brevibacillus fortis]|uniref:Uncharacterized protein n=1 Tax=Brevibacillus fortis TaxID=2126352 RepID=A0A2P7UYZ7_9BACL|nr:hypothetical protein [Brevibacillus fortis]PSJ92133.1 hypothetical protein C7R93_20355 [Brevibacillus fortis]
MKNESQPYTDFREMYRDIDFAAEAYYIEFFHAYKTDGRFPEVYTLEQTKRASSAIQLLQLLEWEWNPVRLLALLSTVGAALGIGRPIPVYDFCSMIEGAALIGTPYVDYYTKKKDILIATLEMFANEEP